jgi:hypothetical protein
MVTLPILPQAGDEITALWGQQVADLLARVVDPRFVQVGNPTIPANSGGTVSSLAIVFPTPFVNPPRVLLTVTSNNQNYIPSSAALITVAGCTLSTRAASGNHTNAIGVTWLAIDLTYLRA